MIGYVDAFLQRQDRANVMSKIENFTVEAAARRALSEIMATFNKQQTELKQKVTNIELIVKASEESVKKSNEKMKRHERMFDELKVFEKETKTQFQLYNDFKNLTDKKFIGTMDRID